MKADHVSTVYSWKLQRLILLLLEFKELVSLQSQEGKFSDRK